MNQWFDIGAAAVGGLAGMAGKIGQKQREERQLGYTKELMEIQQRNQMALNKQGAELSYQQWLDTNYPAQVEQLRKAGLNPALLYGGGPGPGGSTNAGSGGGAGGGQAPRVENLPMDITQALQAAMLSAQIKNVEADTKEKEVRAEKTAGVDTDEARTRIDSMLVGMDTERERQEVMRAEAEFKTWQTNTLKGTFNSTIRQAEYEWKNLEQVYRQNAVRANVDEATQQTAIDQKKADLMNTIWDSKLKESGIGVNDSQRAYLANQITTNLWQMEILEKRQLTQEDAIKLQRTLGEKKLDLEWFNSTLGRLFDIIPSFGVKRSTEYRETPEGVMRTERQERRGY